MPIKELKFILYQNICKNSIEMVISMKILIFTYYFKIWNWICNELQAKVPLLQEYLLQKCNCWNLNNFLCGLCVNIYKDI